MAEFGLFGRIAVEKGLANEAQVARAVRAQEELRSLGFRKQLGELLVEDGVLKVEDVMLILRLQEINERVKSDKLFGRIAVKNRLVTQEQFDSAFDAVSKEGHRLSVREVLVEQGLLEPSAVRAIRHALERQQAKDKAEAQDPNARSTTARLGAALELEPQDAPASGGVEKKVQDVLLAAIALRDGHLHVPELERALRDQAWSPDDRSLAEVLVERGALHETDLPALEAALAAARDERLRIPGYEITGLLGRGATSIVVRARQALIDREVAIKVFRSDHVAATDAEKIIEEARAVAKIQHPHVVTLFDVGRVRRRFYHVMELVDGPTLLDLILERGFLSEPEALGVAREVASGLDAIGRAGLVHRDVKPQNILMNDQGVAKLADLGLAREVGRSDEAPEAIFGTPYTISPEQVQGLPVDIRADLYGLGATLYYALTGSPPYEGTHSTTVMTRHVTDPVPDPRDRKPEVSAETAALVMALLAKGPEDRPPTPSDVIEEIDAILDPTEEAGAV